MDLMLIVWVGLMGIVPPGVLGYIMYRMGLKRGREEKEQAKLEIKQEISKYVREELAHDLVEAVSNAVITGIRGTFGPHGRKGSEESQALLIETAQKNPGIAQVLLQVATRGGARAVGKQFGLSTSTVDAIVAGGANFGGSPFMFPQSKRKSDDLAPVVPAGPP